MRYTTESFKEKARQIHANKYDYSLVEYQTAHNNITIICPIHGQFLQRPDAHIHQKQGCPKCGLSNRRLPHKKNTEQFIEEAQKKWGNKYDYSITNYDGKENKLKYICPQHGVIEQKPYRHIRCGCPFCNGRGISRHSKTSFVAIANKVHGSKYDYSKSEFLRMNDPIVITCPEHGDFVQRAGNHIHLQNGCPGCSYQFNSSKEEDAVLDFLKNNYSGLIETHDRKIFNGKEIDIYLPEIKLGIEYDGIYWHLETVRGRKLHYEKWKMASEAGIRLIQIYSNEWLEKRPIVESKLLSTMGKSTRIGARDTKLVELDKHTKDEFLTKNHIQGSDSSKLYYGLVHKDCLVSCMTFGPSRFNKKYDYELVRFCNACGVTVVGGASKLLKHFRDDHSGSVISYADKRYSDGRLYFKLGFDLDGETDPSFAYFNISSGVLYNRMNFQKHRIKTMPGYSPELSEYEIMQLNGYDRIWDAGQFRFVMK